MILSAGLSPARQMILTFPRLSVGEVNRASQVHRCASGKVLNVARAVAALGGSGHVLCTAGGAAGESLRAEFEQDRIGATWIETHSQTRTCTTLLDESAPAGRRVTELVENAQPITPQERDAFVAEFGRLESSADLVIFTGSLPPVPGEGDLVSSFATLLDRMHGAILDIRGAELKRALPHRPLLVKPNRQELAATLGRTLPDETAVRAGMQELAAAGAGWVLVTDGPRPALLSNGDSEWRIVPPVVESVVNPIGCGDCLAAGIAVAVADGTEMVDAVQFGMAASIENLRHVLPARLRLEVVRSLVNDVLITPCH
jgi:tagatose 6-phosphate kinase